MLSYARWTMSPLWQKVGTDASAPRAALWPENLSLLIVVAVVLAIAFAFVVSNVAANHQPEPHNLPVGIVGSPHVTDPVVGQLELNDPGAFKVISYSSPEAARTAILNWQVYGAFVPGSAPTLLVASAASLPVENVLKQTFEAVTSSQGQTLAVHDVAPLPPRTPRAPPRSQPFSA